MLQHRSADIAAAGEVTNRRDVELQLLLLLVVLLLPAKELNAAA